ncbi:MAG: PLP-dependent transferase [Candidatus Bipolaricaulia bacterium]
MTHAAIPEGERHKRGSEENLLRISVGIENYADLERDLGNALERA